MEDAHNVPLPPDNDDIARPSSLRLPAFWPDTPASWFSYAESKFRLQRITAELDKFDHLVGALSRESIRTVLHLVEAPPAENPYTALKESLMSSHQLTNFQRIEKLHHMEALGNRKPSDLLHQMLELCPRGQERNEFFLFLFLQRLPSELRIMLGDDTATDPRELGVKADRLWAMHSHRMHGQVAAVAATANPEDPGAIAAVRPNPARGGKRGGQQRGGQRGRGDGKRTAPRDLAQTSAGLCYYHWNFGEKATDCKQPCSWTGN